MLHKFFLVHGIADALQQAEITLALHRLFLRDFGEGTGTDMRTAAQAADRNARHFTQVRYKMKDDPEQWGVV